MPLPAHPQACPAQCQEGTSPWERVLLTRQREAGERPGFPAFQGTAHRTCCSFTPAETSKADLYREGSEREEGPWSRSYTVPSGLLCRGSQQPSLLRTTTGLWTLQTWHPHPWGPHCGPQQMAPGRTSVAFTADKTNSQYSHCGPPAGFTTEILIHRFFHIHSPQGPCPSPLLPPTSCLSPESSPAADYESKAPACPTASPGSHTHVHQQARPT